MAVLDYWGSDHRAISLQLKLMRRNDNISKLRGFRFEPLWVKHEECPGIVEESWKKFHLGGSPSRLVSGLSACAGSLRRWGSKTFGNIPRKVARLQKSVEDLHKGPRDSVSMDRIREAEKELDKVLG